MSALYTTGFDQKQKSYYYEKIGLFADDFILAGGTAIMLQLNHRRSWDFDLFTDQPLKPALLRKCKQIFGSDLNVQVDNSDLLLFVTADNVKIDFIYHPYPPQHKLISGDVINLFDLKDLAGDKARTVGRRATWRDYVDLFFFLKWKLFSLEIIINQAEQRFEGEFNDKLFLEQLSYFEDFKITPIEFLQETYTSTQIKSFLTQKTEQYIQKQLHF